MSQVPTNLWVPSTRKKMGPVVLPILAALAIVYHLTLGAMAVGLGQQ